MLQISNLDDGKPDWNVNETHIIIPMIDGDIISNKGSDKIATSTITLNTLDGEDQTILTNGIEHSLVIGLDRNLFETHNNKNDVLVVQNSDLKLLSCNGDMKNPVTYTLSYIDQDRSEILWESPVSKDKTKLEWCSNDKAIFEVKDVLNYDDSVQDSSKNWHNDLEKNSEQISLDDVGGDLTSQVAKINGEILIPVDDVLNESKKCGHDVEQDNHFIVNYYPVVQNNEGISLVPVSTVVAKPVQEKSITLKTENLISNELHVKSCSSKASKILSFKGLTEPQENMLSIMPDKENYNKLIPSNYQETEMGTESVRQINKEEVPMGSGVSSSLPEKSLPLKKKAKMKRTMVLCGPENVKSLSKHEVAAPDHSSTFAKEQESEPPADNSDSDEPLINKVKKRKILTKSVPKNQKEKSSTSLVCEEGELIRFNVSIVESNDKTPSTKFSRSNINFENRNFDSIYELVDELKKYRLINASVWETLQSGLKEMDVDILKEMNASKQKNKTPGDDASYSTQLKAFALVLYFKQPAAFNHLSKLYSNGWPSLAVIKDWKRRVNSHQRPNFVGLQRGSENDKPKCRQ